MANKRTARNWKKYIIIAVIAIICVCLGLYIADYWNLLPRKTYSAEDFGITTVTSSIDRNRNGVDDYTDILLGARQDALSHPKYDGRYFDGGYPPDNIGVCTDVIWRAFKNAGYCLRDMIDKDIQLRPEAYPNVTSRDINIDFRRVANLKVFFEEYAVSLTLDPDGIEEWQPGDIVIFNDDHIGIISDKRNSHGVAYVIHNAGQPVREENYLSRSTITGHYRFDAGRIDESVLISME